MTPPFLSEIDASLVGHTLNALTASGLSAFAVTGSLASKASFKRRPYTRRAFNDLDIVVRSFEALPPSLIDRFLCIHVHPDAPPGKLLLQLANPSNPLRVDIFRSRGWTMERVKTTVLAGVSVKLASVKDLAALNAVHLMSLRRGNPVPSKHLQDFYALLDVVNHEAAERAWADHRALGDPMTFAEASDQVKHLAAANGHLLCAAEYSQDVEASCPKCKIFGSFAPASAQEIIKILGYC